MRCIDADALIKALVRKEPFSDCARVVIAECMGEIRHAPTIEPEPKWIPCSEKLPYMWDERYLVSLAWGGIGVMEYKSTGFHNYGSFAPVPIESITAWMPLPEPYREEGENE